jgi:DinB superfamily
VKHTLPLLLGLSLTLQAQSANPLSAEVKSAYNSVKNNLLQSAEKMPEDGYSFKPTPDIRSFAEVLGHVVSAQTHACGAVVGGTSAGTTKNETKSEVLTALKAAFDVCDKAYDSLTDANAAEMIQSPRGARSRLGVLTGNVAHDNEQYGILSVYMRLKGVIPPSSESAGRKK